MGTWNVVASRVIGPASTEKTNANEFSIDVIYGSSGMRAYFNSSSWFTPYYQTTAGKLYRARVSVTTADGFNVNDIVVHNITTQSVGSTGSASAPLNYHRATNTIRIDEGTMYLEEYTPTPPGQPSFISYASSVEGGSNLPISWGTGTGATRYHLHRSVNGAGYSQIYQGVSTSFTDSIPANSWSSVRYMVQAYNTDGYSTQRVGPTISVINNYPPSTPSSIYIPNLVSGSSAYIYWAASTDADGDTIYYQLQRSVNSGSYVTVTSSTTSTGYSDSISSAWSTVNYRVRAYDGQAYSSYRTGSTKTVYHPAPPSIPSSISVPDVIRGGKSISISWGIGSGATRYHLERSVDGGTYSQIYSGAVREYVDSIVRGWQNVRYRVRSYNSDGYSAFRTSDLRTIKNFAEFQIRIDGSLKVSADGWSRIDNQLRQIESITIRINDTLKEV